MKSAWIPAAVPMIAPGTATTISDGWLLVSNLRVSEVRMLKGTSVFIWQAIDGIRTVPQICERAVAAFGEQYRAQINGDVRRLLDILEEDGVVVYSLQELQ